MALRITGPEGKGSKIDRFDKGPWKNQAGYRDPNGEVEKPRGEWNLLELVTQGGQVKQYVNGRLMTKAATPFQFVERSCSSPKAPRFSSATSSSIH